MGYILYITTTHQQHYKASHKFIGTIVRSDTGGLTFGSTKSTIEREMEGRGIERERELQLVSLLALIHQQDLFSTFNLPM